MAARVLRLRETTPSANEVRRWATTVPYVLEDGKAREAGMRTMREDGQRKVASGMTTIEEVMGATVADDVL